MAKTFKVATLSSYTDKNVGCVIEDRGEEVTFADWKDGEPGFCATAHRTPSVRPDSYHRVELQAGDSVRTEPGWYKALRDMVVWVRRGGDGPFALIEK